LYIFNTKCSLKDYYPLLYEIVINKDITVDKVIGYNRFYLYFNRPLNVVLAQQLESLYIKLSNITLTIGIDDIKWRWSNNELFSVKSCYHWLDFGGIKSFRYISTWTATIPLRIIIFLWLVQQNKILTKDNLLKKGTTTIPLILSLLTP
jgi:zinc-binding in reverse transcriptase